jgi:hypothetical protein
MLWSEQPTTATVPLPSVVFHSVFQTSPPLVAPTTVPTFHAYTLTVPADADRVSVWVYALSGAGDPALRYDGLVLAEGDRSEGVPGWLDGSGAAGAWAGEPFTNLLANGSFERSQPFFQPVVQHRLSPIISASPNIALGALLAPAARSAYYGLALRTMLETFWGRFGWGQVPMAPPAVYATLGLALLCGALGGALCLIRARRHVPWRPITLFVLVTLVVWAVSSVRGIETLFGNTWVWTPGARYAAPVMVPTALWLVAGWREFGRLAWVAARHVRPTSGWVSERLPRLMVAAYTAALAALNVFALLTVVSFYSRDA